MPTLTSSLYRLFFSTRLRATVTILFLLAALTGFCFVSYAYFIESRTLQTVEYTVVSPDLPSEFDGTVIVLITDTHQGRWGTFDLRNKVVELTKKEKPDLILFGGDYADKKYYKVEALAESMNALSAPLGKFGVPGNHDYVHLDMEKVMGILQEKGGIVNLTDKGVWLEKNGQRIRLFGTDYVWNRRFPLQFPYYEMNDRTEDEFVVLLTHSPDLFDRFDPEHQRRIDLVLAGHSHGGQVTFFGLYAPISMLRNRAYTSGRIDVEHFPYNKTSTIITSNGVGTTGVPLRFFSPPQIVKVTLKKQ
ncbi:MAG: metallophosphoesterase [Thermoguttaceae bacterium]|nr:metallophosphoesterase [Thermoguttaceae bacterium]